ncbi:MAG TPA: lipid-binding SYLF domain-containing protein [Blastocatellia bacterium]
MKLILKSSLLILVIVSAAAAQTNRKERADEVQRLNRAAQVFTEIMQTPDKAIPEDLLDKTECIAIVPGLKKGAFIVGARYGKGVVMCRRPNRRWSAPSFLTVEGGNIGFQIGGSSTDVVMLIMNKEGMNKLIGDKFTIGGDASAAAGPVGRRTSAETNIRLDAQILTYSRSKGLFAGISLDGSVVKQDKDDNRDFYGKEMDARTILFTDEVPIPAEAKSLAAALSRESPKKK